MVLLKLSAFSGLGPEYDYVRVLNRALPDDIRVIGWSPAPTDFHARYECYLFCISFVLVCTIRALKTAEYFVNYYWMVHAYLLLFPCVQVQLLS